MVARSYCFSNTHRLYHSLGYGTLGYPLRREIGGWWVVVLTWPSSDTRDFDETSPSDEQGRVVLPVKRTLEKVCTGWISRSVDVGNACLRNSVLDFDTLPNQKVRFQIYQRKTKQKTNYTIVSPSNKSPSPTDLPDRTLLEWCAWWHHWLCGRTNTRRTSYMYYKCNHSFILVT